MAFVVERIKRRSPAPKTAASAVRPMSIVEQLGIVRAFKEQARRLRGPQSNNPNAFHEDKSELVNAIIRYEEALRRGCTVDDLPVRT